MRLSFAVFLPSVQESWHFVSGYGQIERGNSICWTLLTVER